MTIASSTRRWLRPVGLLTVALAVLLGVSTPPALAGPGDVVMMPDRDALMGTPVVVWGNTQHPNGTAFSLDFGDLSAPVAGTVADRSYIAFAHTYANSGVYTATLTVGADTDTVVIEVFDGAALNAENLRSLGINMAIEDGLRYLYYAQNDRQAAQGTNFTSWTTWSWNPDFMLSYTSLAILAFENHGHTVLDDPTQDIYQPVVQRGLNYIFDNLAIVTLGVQASGDPCVGVPADANLCVGLGRPAWSGHSMYASAVITLAVAGSGAPARTVAAGIGAGNSGFVAGRTYGEILQRQANTIMWGMGDSGAYRGGFCYDLNGNWCSDGSTAGWGVLALLDAEAAGATIPPWVRTDVAYYLTQGLNADGSLKYQVDPWYTNQSNFPKTGIGLQVMAFTGRPVTDASVQGAIGLLSGNWPSGYSSDGFDGHNKGHAYGMFNAFKGLKLFAVQTLPGVSRPAGPGTIPAGDWHADYQDYLVTQLMAPTSTSGGSFNMPFGFSYCGTCDLGGGLVSFTSIAELILSPVALVLPANLSLAPETASNETGTSHTVTATATSASGSPVAGATVTFTVLSGPNAGDTGSGVTDTTGQATFTYTGDGGPGSDNIRANIGQIESNIVAKIWYLPNQPPDCTAAAAGPSMIWPPNHQFVPIGILGVTDPDGDPLTIAVTSIYQDEPLTGGGQGAGNTPYDGILSPAQVRAERNGNPKTPGDGRVYHVTFTATDPGGASCTATVTICVPHDQRPGATCVDGGPLVKSTQ